MIGIIIPTLNRGDKLADVAKNIHENTTEQHKIYFVAESTDEGTKKASKACQEDCIINEEPGTHTGAANTAYRKTTEEYFIVANDDFIFHPEWDTKALACMSDNIHVVGLNDLGASKCDTIFLIKRQYIKEQSGCMDIPNVVFFPGYHHNYVDTEFWGTALKRGVCVKCPDSRVEHMHPGFGKAHLDSTYEKANSHVDEDRATYISRQHLWR